MKAKTAGGTDEAAAMRRAARGVERVLRRHRVALTMGGEPTYVPLEPSGAEWSYAAVGPTKLAFAEKFAAELVGRHLPGAAVIMSPGKQYPGETNPRWSLQILARRDGAPIVSPPPVRPRRLTPPLFEKLRVGLAERLRVNPACWRRAHDPTKPDSPVWVLPLDHDKKRSRWHSKRWTLRKGSGGMVLLDTEGPAGLRLPLASLREGAILRALTLGINGKGQLEVFLPPVLDAPHAELLAVLDGLASRHRLAPPALAGYVPADDAGRWTRLGVAADPGVIEVNLPPCRTWRDYSDWLHKLEDAAGRAGLRSWKLLWTGQPVGTGGGNHILFGGPTINQNPFFPRPWWLARIIRYWQAHPALSYLFTGIYVGPSSQAPRPDESSRGLTDLEMAYAFLETLGADADKSLVNETIRHMHIDASGNTHRTEISVDKFWTPGTPAGCSGLIEFRAVESLPRADWMAAVGLLWRALAAMLLDTDAPRPLATHGASLHDKFFLPSFLTADMDSILDDLERAGLPLPRKIFHDMAGWRLPGLHSWSDGDGATLDVRAALEGWPLLCEVPVDGGATSRFVDTSIERLEVRANNVFARHHRLLVGSAEISLHGGDLPDGVRLAGVRYRRSALYPCLHPGLPLDMPLRIAIVDRASRHVIHSAVMAADAFAFEADATPVAPPKPWRLLPSSAKHSLTHDLRNSHAARPPDVPKAPRR